MIVTRETILEKARTAFFLGLPREANPFNWTSCAGAYQDWNAEYDRLAAEQQEQAA